MIESLEVMLAAFGLKLKVVLAGAVGAFISLRYFEGLTARERWLTFMGGWGMATFLTQLIQEIAELSSIGAEIGISLLIALFGMSVVGTCIKLLREEGPVMIRDLWKRFFGGSVK